MHMACARKSILLIFHRQSDFGLDEAIFFPICGGSKKDLILVENIY